ncbi:MULTISPECIES: hypothetical protein [Pseudomonas]|uniref:hypothetical protein n=1 Tax=Pseudomonas TaxID=286 RepID=UPI000F76D904|nr:MULTISPECIES: hypothetical protein [Pseudomonas]MBZ3664894.1 hypothetical protein [Pseudomonas monteilii]MBZ3670239.1 hypothetical protein [Pseudomonas monteilii]QEQ86084.1 hypothetical protein F1602_01605 [Pseudomonas putida]RRV19454.1 hypothetical protein EGJ22_10385 [Pseudomonas sp. p99-361]TFW37597.1 hypothetical protein E4195_11615 [Pseudomonas putida]
MSKINLQIELDEQQAEHYLQWLNSQYTLTMAEVWYSDRYRNVPVGERGPKVLADVPHLQGICRTRKALERKLGSAVERSR